jgi:hypothetical protein
MACGGGQKLLPYLITYFEAGLTYGGAKPSQDGAVVVAGELFHCLLDNTLEQTSPAGVTGGNGTAILAA